MWRWCSRAATGTRVPVKSRRYPNREPLPADSRVLTLKTRKYGQLLYIVVSEKKTHNKGFKTLKSSNLIDLDSDKDVINTLFPTLVLLF